jgi:hypothetical protein
MAEKSRDLKECSWVGSQEFLLSSYMTYEAYRTYMYTRHKALENAHSANDNWNPFPSSKLCKDDVRELICREHRQDLDPDVPRYQQVAYLIWKDLSVADHQVCDVPWKAFEHFPTAFSQCVGCTEVVQPTRHHYQE